MNFEIKIPIKRHLKLFVHSIENIPPNGAVDLSGKGLISLYLTHFFDTKRSISNHRIKKIPTECTEELTVILNQQKIDRYRTVISDVHVVIFNNFLHKLFIYNMYLFVVQAHQHRIEKREAIATFLAMHNIGEDDYSFEAAKKAVFRLEN